MVLKWEELWVSQDADSRRVSDQLGRVRWELSTTSSFGDARLVSLSALTEFQCDLGGGCLYPAVLLFVNRFQTEYDSCRIGSLAEK
jgi:hypothetical protein